MKVKLGTLREYLDCTFPSSAGADPLGLLKEFTVDILIEGRVEDARERFPDMEDEDFDFLVAQQPAGSNNKFLLWSCKQAEALLETDPDRQALSLVIQAVRLFSSSVQRLTKKDLNQYESVTEVEQAVQELGKSKGEKGREVKANSDAVYNDDRFTVIRPYTTESSQKYGAGTKWCIAATTNNYFNSYSTNNNKFYFVIDKTLTPADPASKFAIVIASSTETGVQVFNAPDRQVGLKPVMDHVGDKWPAMWAKIKEHVKAHPDTREVEDARKATDDHVKALLKDEKISPTAMGKVAKDAKLTAPVVKAMLKQLKNYTGPSDYRDPRMEIMGAFANRSSELPQEMIKEIIEWIGGTKPEGDNAYWSGHYHLDKIMQEANLTSADFYDLAKSGSEPIIANLVANPHCPADLLKQVQGQVQKFKDKASKQKVYWQLIKTNNISEEQFKEAVGVGQRDAYGSLRHQVLYGKHGEEPLDLPGNLISLIPISSAEDLKAILKMPRATPEFVSDVVDRSWTQLKKYDLWDILKTAKFSTEKIEQMWKDKGQDIRMALLQNPAIGTGTAAKFAKSKNSAYRFAIAHNPIATAEDLKELAKDASVSTRSAVAAHSSTPEATLKTLAGDEAVNVRAGVASNKSTPLAVLKSLMKDSDEFVRKTVRKTIKSMTAAEGLRPLAIVLKEAIEDEDMKDIMTPGWRDIPKNMLEPEEFVAVFLLQNNGHATREEIEEAFNSWNPRTPTNRTVGGGGYRGRFRGRRQVAVPAKSLVGRVKRSVRCS